MIKSKFNPILTLKYMAMAEENKWFDRKSSRIKPSDIYDLISAFANAEGGTIVIGISDKTKEIEGLNGCDDVKVNEFINAPKSGCKPMPTYEVEFLDITNSFGEEDRLLLLHIHSSPDQIIRTVNDSTYLRIGDRTRELKGEDLRNLEYSKSTRHYEDECNMDAQLSDLDIELITEYKKILGAEHLSTEQVLV
jgi:ATP-dependent DNA helicase RecG